MKIFTGRLKDFNYMLKVTPSRERSSAYSEAESFIMDWTGEVVGSWSRCFRSDDFVTIRKAMLRIAKEDLSE